MSSIKDAMIGEGKQPQKKTAKADSSHLDAENDSSSAPPVERTKKSGKKKKSRN